MMMEMVSEDGEITMLDGLMRERSIQGIRGDRLLVWIFKQTLILTITHVNIYWNYGEGTYLENKEEIYVNLFV